MKPLNVFLLCIIVFNIGLHFGHWDARHGRAAGEEWARKTKAFLGLPPREGS